jgi:DNA-binding CsgD family transcriptional regulator/tetratricopeptide (TPR) repeat protein
MIRPVRSDGTIETGGVFVPVARRRVIERIASAAMQRIVLIVAPAGYGKSVALRQYLDGVDEPRVRFDVLPEHATFLGFLRGLSDALIEVAPDARATLAGAYEKNAASYAAGTDLAMWMHSHLKSFRGIVAIDDLHVAQGDRDVTQFLTSLIERTKGRVQWILASRATVGLPIGTWLAYGESDLAIDEHDLKFTVDESRDAARAFRLGVRDEELFELLHLTDGWPTAMSFALRSSTRSIDLRNVASMTRDMIYRYLAEQVYVALSESERDFLETASLLPEFDVTVMAAAGFDRAAATIDGLRQRVAFLHEQGPGVYRLHDLFGDFVRHQFSLRGESTVLARALEVARVLEDLGRPVPALRLFERACEPDALFRVLLRDGFDLIGQGFSDDVSRAIDALPEPSASDAAIVALRGLIAIANGSLKSGERLLESSVENVGDGSLRARFRLRLAMQQANAGADPVDLLESIAGDATRFPPIALEAKAFLAYVHAARGRLDVARELAEAVGREISGVTDEGTLARVLLRLGNVRFSLRDFEASKTLLLQAAELASQRSLWGTSSRANQALANLALWHDSDTASSLWYAQQASACANRAGDYQDAQRALLIMLSLETRRGNVERVAQVEGQLIELSRNDAGITNFLVSSQAHRAAWDGRFGDAVRNFSTIRGRQRFPIDRAFVHAAYALCLALDGARCVDACREALEVLRESKDTESVVWSIAGLFVVLAELVAGRAGASKRLIGRFVASHHDVVRFAGAAVSELLLFARNRSHDLNEFEQHVEGIAAAGYGGYARYFRLCVRAIAGDEGSEAVHLTRSELRILQCLAAGMTPKDIAADMGRSILTVQTHVQNLTRKLGGHGRAEAIAAARRRGLL